MRNSSCIVLAQLGTEIRRSSNVKPVSASFTLQYIQIDKSAHILSGLPSRSSPRNCGKIKVRLRSGYGATVCALRYRCERRLEPRGLPKQVLAPAFDPTAAGFEPMRSTPHRSNKLTPLLPLSRLLACPSMSRLPSSLHSLLCGYKITARFWSLGDSNP